MRRLLTEKRRDRLAAVAIRTGGLLVIVIVVAIVVDIGLQAVPLFLGARAGRVEIVPSAGAQLAAGSDPRRELVWAVGRDGIIRFPAGSAIEPLLPFAQPTNLVAADHEIGGLLVLLASDGRVAAGRVRFRDDWSAAARRTTADWRPAAAPLELPPDRRWTGATANADAAGDLLLAAWSEAGELAVRRWDAEPGAWHPVEVALPGRAASAAVAEGLDAVAVVLEGGGLVLRTGPGLAAAEVEGPVSPLDRVRFLIGGGTLVAAAPTGALSVLLEVPRVSISNRGTGPVSVDGVRLQPGETAVLADTEFGARLSSRPELQVLRAEPVWRVVRRLPDFGSQPTSLAAGSRRRDLLVGGANGTVALYYSTSGRRLLADRWGPGPVTALALDPKADGAVAVAGGTLLRRSISNPHPEVSLRTLFLPVHYEGYASAKWVWQTTGGSDASEPKLSLWPLIFGTLKATLYALLFSVPLALMAAVYVSQLAPARLQTIIKPTLELMAGVPSVVVGFLAALWLAPRLEAALLATIVGAAALPLSVLVALAVWRIAPAGLRRRMPRGGELVVLAISAAGVLIAAVLLTGPVESALFGGDFQRFLFTELGIRYDQRNSIVVGIALGFAVIPVIFTIAEDACSAVPQSLISASRALGATRWQTAVRLVVPAASPGLFAAVMLGLGRAVGETMIVLMAAGNTPLLDPSLFNGMRTMSAAIAVEISEAPVGSTLFRVLFLTGTLLFLFTLVVTTAADVVGSYLRKRYARF